MQQEKYICSYHPSLVVFLKATTALRGIKMKLKFHHTPIWLKLTNINMKTLQKGLIKIIKALSRPKLTQQNEKQDSKSKQV